jgi:phage-related protein
MIIDIKVSPKNLLEWGNMEDWDAGDAAAPSEHTLAGASATVAKESTIVKQGSYSAKVTRVGADATLYHDFPDFADYKGRRVTFGCWVYATVADRARIAIDDGVDDSESSYHTGASAWEFLTVTRDIDVSATQVRVEMQVNTGNTAAYFDGCILVDGALTFLDLSQYVESWSPNRKIRINKYQISRRAGLLITAQEYEERSLSFKGKISGTTATTARAAYDTFLQTLNDGEKDLYLHDDRFFRVYLSSESHEYIAASRIIKFDVKFTAEKPFTSSLQRLRNKQTISSSPTSFTITNNGTVYTKPIIQITAGGSDVTDCLLENLTTGQSMTFTNDIAAGNTLEVDCDELTVLNDSVDEIGAFAGDFLQINPGANIFKFTGTNCTIKVDYFERHL